MRKQVDAVVQEGPIKGGVYTSTHQPEIMVVPTQVQVRIEKVQVITRQEVRLDVQKQTKKDNFLKKILIYLIELDIITLQS